MSDCGCGGLPKKREQKPRYVWKCPKGVKQIGMGKAALEAAKCRRVRVDPADREEK